MSATVLEDDVDPNYTHFAHRSEFLALLRDFLQCEGSQTCDESVKEMGAILDVYLPSPGLLDPSLHEIVPPLIAKIAEQLRQLRDGPEARTADSPNLLDLGRVVNWVVKVRGWKAVVPQLPSEIQFLPLLVDILSPPTIASSSATPSTPHHPSISGEWAWEIRAVLLLWLSMLLTVPFDLQALSHETTPSSPYVDYPSRQLLFSHPLSNLAQQVVLLAAPLLYRPGKEGAYAALVLARLYSREDAAAGLKGFLDWAGRELQEGEREGEANLVAAILEFLAILPTLVKPDRSEILHDFTHDTLLPHLHGTVTASSSGLIRKLAFKATGRWWMAKLRTSDQGHQPDGIEDFLGDLMSGLGDKHTVVRYSAAKYLARIASLLPLDFRDQIVSATIDLFAGTADEPVVETPFGTIVDPGGSEHAGSMGFGGSEPIRGEARWHGICLALAEMARRGLIREESAPETIRWVLKALTFDLRRASHSVGSNVRDAAAYLLWSLSRSCSPATLAPYAARIATALICVSCLDREVGVRRAASAAFQEGVGRLGVYPGGIDVLAKTDFYSVSVRRIAFHNAAPAVAIHEIYRQAMREHLHNITLRHWDADMRKLGAQTLSTIVALGTERDRDDAIHSEITMLSSVDTGSIHGGLLALAELSSTLGSTDGRRTLIFAALSTIRASVLVTGSAADIIEAACEVMTRTMTPNILAVPANRGQLDHLIQTAMRRREPACQEAVADVYAQMSSQQDSQKEVAKLLVDLKSSRAAIRQASALCLGHILYHNALTSLQPVCKALLYQLDEAAKADVETRRYAIRSLSDITSQELIDHVDGPSTFRIIITAFIAALSDYSTDQRGDIGSWVRVTALEALGKTLALPQASGAIDRPLVDSALSGIIKQSVEKLETCRCAAYKALETLRKAGIRWEGDAALSFGEVMNDADFRDIDQRVWYNSATQLLHTQYRSSVVSGLVHSIGSSIESLSKHSLAALLEAVRDDSHLLSGVLADLATLLSNNLNTSRVFLPTLNTATKLLSADEVVVPVAAIQTQEALLKIGNTASRGVAQLKSIERLTASMRLLVALSGISIPAVQAKAIDSLELFLAHRFPRIRAITAEQLYLKLSEDDVEPELEELLLETSWTDSEAPGQANVVSRLLKEFYSV